MLMIDIKEQVEIGKSLAGLQLGRALLHKDLKVKAFSDCSNLRYNLGARSA